MDRSDAVKALIAIVIVAAGVGRADAKGCHETSYVVGFEHCSGFGEWSRDSDYPRIWLDLGYFDHHYPSHRFVLGHQELLDSEPASLRTDSRGGLLRVGVGLGRVFYVGGELELGGANVETGLLGKDPEEAVSVAVHGFAGVHTEIGHVSFAGELATGPRGEDYDACASQDQRCTTLEAAQGHFDLEARARVELFVQGHVSVGAMFGQSLIESSNHELMLTVGLHIRALDGM